MTSLLDVMPRTLQFAWHMHILCQFFASAACNQSLQILHPWFQDAIRLHLVIYLSKYRQVISDINPMVIHSYITFCCPSNNGCQTQWITKSAWNMHILPHYPDWSVIKFNLILARERTTQLRCTCGEGQKGHLSRLHWVLNPD